MNKKTQFISVLKPCRPDLHCTVTEQETKIFEEHIQYNKNMFSEKFIEFVGTSFEENEKHFAIIIINAESKTKAYDIIENDPAVKHKLLISKITEFSTYLSH